MTAKSSPLLELDRVTYQINGRRILDNITWTVQQGDNWAVLGPNGAGKTTLLRIVCGYLWPNRGGKVRRKGKADSDLGRLWREIGWVTSAIVEDIPKGELVIETVLSGRYAQLGLWSLPNEAPTPDVVEAARSHLAALGCSDLSERRFGTLSQGERQKVLICRALMAAPYLLILDEPCAGLDPGNRELFLADLMSLGQKPQAPRLIYVTHHPEEILPIFNKCLILKTGRIFAAGPTEAVLTSTTMTDIYGVSLRLTKRKGRYWPTGY